MNTTNSRTRAGALVQTLLASRATLLSVALLILAPTAGADSNHQLRGSDHAPIGVMADHTHEAGEMMVSYRYMRMRMEGNRSGRRRQSPSEVRALGFPVVPTDMDMDMHMWGLMWSPHDRITLTGMIPYIEFSMDHTRPMPTPRFTTKSSGIGDIRVGALISLFKREDHRAHIGLGLALPTGSAGHRDFIVPMGSTHLPYPMQTGSGSWSFLPSATYTGKSGDWGWGAQLNGAIRLAENRRGYRLGDRLNTTAWFSRDLCEALSTSLRLNFDHWGNIHGSDRDLTLTAPPTADPRRRGGDRLEAGIGANYVFQNGTLRGVRLAAEFLHPITQKLDGPQLETDWNLTIGLQYAF